MRQLLHQIRILLAHILRVATEHADRAVLKLVHLRTLAIVLVLARELLVLEPVEHLADRFRGFCQHGLQRHARGELTAFAQPVDPDFQECGYDKVVRWKFASTRYVRMRSMTADAGCLPVYGFDHFCGFLKSGGHFLFADALVCWSNRSGLYQSCS